SPGRPIASPVSRRETPTPHRYLCLHVPAVSYPAAAARAQPPADSGRVTDIDFARPSGQLAHTLHTTAQDAALTPGVLLALAHAPGLRRPVTAISSAQPSLLAPRAQRHIRAHIPVTTQPLIVGAAQAAIPRRPVTAGNRALGPGPGGSTPERPVSLHVPVRHQSLVVAVAQAACFNRSVAAGDRARGRHGGGSAGRGHQALLSV